jgi:hypothetical protein
MLVSARALTVVVVAHDDSQKLLGTIDRIYSALAVTVEGFSIVVFDDGSTDDTLAVAKATWQNFGLPLLPAQWFFIVPSALLFSMIPISAGGWGVREAL